MSAATQAPPPASETNPHGPHHSDHGFLFWIIGGVAIVLCVIGLITYSANKNDAEAQQKAAQLTAAFKQAGLPVPAKQDQITATLGTDGGAVCQNPADALGRATLNAVLVNGASFVGQRPVIVPRRIVEGELLILQIYCPEKLQDYKDKVDDLKFDDTIKP
jgi:hypothetical protein